MRVKLIWIVIAFLLLDAVLVAVFFLAKKRGNPPVGLPVVLSPSPAATSPTKRWEKPAILFESSVDGVKIEVVDKQEIEKALSEVKFWQAWIATPKVYMPMDKVDKIKVVLTDKRPVDKSQEVKSLQTPDGEVYQSTGISLEGKDTLIFSIFLSPKFFRTESPEQLTLRFLSQFLRTVAAFGLKGEEYETFKQSGQLGKILRERWRGKMPVKIVVSSNQKT